MAASRAATLGQFQLLFGVIVGVAAGSFYAPMTATTTRWFVEHRSLAVALVSAGLGLGSMTMAPLAGWIITSYDWRVAMLVIGDLAWLLLIPAALLVRNPPAAAPVALGPRRGRRRGSSRWRRPCAPRSSRPSPSPTSRAARRTRARSSTWSPTRSITACPRWPPTTVLGAAGLASLSGRVICGLLADRLGAKRVLIVGLAIQAVAVSLYLVTGQLAGFYALALMFGLAYGGVMPLYAIVVREYFGARIMGATFGAVAFASTLGMALGPWAGGWFYDSLGSYAWLFIASFGIGLGAVAIAFTFRPPAPFRAAVPCRGALTGRSPACATCC